jgi:hypothetical protein
MRESKSFKTIKGRPTMTAEHKRRQHGGKRVGAGRKPKVRSATEIDDDTFDLLVASAHPDQVETAAQRHAQIAVSGLVKKLLRGKSEMARVTAAKEILDRGYGKPGVEIGGDGMLPFFPDAAASRAQPTVSVEMRAAARNFANLAIEVLRRISEFGVSESAVVSACKAILDRSVGTVGVAKMPEELRDRPLGKKEMATRAAETAASGKYATPTPPRSLRDPDDGGSRH